MIDRGSIENEWQMGDLKFFSQGPQVSLGDGRNETWTSEDGWTGFNYYWDYFEPRVVCLDDTDVISFSVTDHSPYYTPTKEEYENDVPYDQWKLNRSRDLEARLYRRNNDNTMDWMDFNYYPPDKYSGRYESPYLQAMDFSGDTRGAAQIGKDHAVWFGEVNTQGMPDFPDQGVDFEGIGAILASREGDSVKMHGGIPIVSTANGYQYGSAICRVDDDSVIYVGGDHTHTSRPDRELIRISHVRRHWDAMTVTHTLQVPRTTFGSLPQGSWWYHKIHGAAVTSDAQRLFVLGSYDVSNMKSEAHYWTMEFKRGEGDNWNYSAWVELWLPSGDWFAAPGTDGLGFPQNQLAIIEEHFYEPDPTSVKMLATVGLANHESSTIGENGRLYLCDVRRRDFGWSQPQYVEQDRWTGSQTRGNPWTVEARDVGKGKALMMHQAWSNKGDEEPHFSLSVIEKHSDFDYHAFGPTTSFGDIWNSGGYFVSAVDPFEGNTHALVSFDVAVNDWSYYSFDMVLVDLGIPPESGGCITIPENIYFPGDPPGIVGTGKSEPVLKPPESISADDVVIMSSLEEDSDIL